MALHLPDELLLEVLSFIPEGQISQGTLYSFCLVSRQWYDLGISRLYASPHLAGSSFALFVQTIAPSINPHIRKSELAFLVKELDLSHIVHQGSKSVTARLLGRTKNNLEVLVAPQASFAINCWAALSKCRKLRWLDLSLVSESIEYQSLAQTLRNLPDLTHLFLPRCSSTLDPALMPSIKWPPKMEHLTLAGGIHGQLWWDPRTQVDNPPSTLTSLSISHCPRIDQQEIGRLLQQLAAKNILRKLSLHHLPQVLHNGLDPVLEWVPHLRELEIALDYIKFRFGNVPSGTRGNPDASLPLERLKLMTCSNSYDDSAEDCFGPPDLFDMIDKRYLARLRYLEVTESTQWAAPEDGAELEAVFIAMEEVDEESWLKRRWHYEGVVVPENWTYEDWRKSDQGKRMRPQLTVLWHQ